MGRNILIIEDKKRTEIECSINRIYQFLKNQDNYDSWGVLNGLSGVILFFAKVYEFYKKDEILNDLYNKIGVLLSHIDKKEGPTLCSGLSGICWLLRYLDSKKLVDCDDIDDILNNIDVYIYHLYVNYFINDLDYLHGGLGIAYYFLLSDNKASKDASKMFLNKLIETKVELDDGSCLWKTQLEDVRKSKCVTVVNFSLSHGMAAIIVFLAKYYETTKDKEAEKLIRQTVKYYVNNVNPPDYYSVFSNWIDLEEPDERNESRLAWCYGDLGIAMALSYAGSVLNDSTIISFSAFVAKKTTHRFSNSQITDATICHGSSGVSLIYYYLYQMLGDDLYKDSALFWLNDTLGRIDSIDFDKTPLNTSQLNNENTLLTGLSGVGIALLSLITEYKESWSEILLLL